MTKEFQIAEMHNAKEGHKIDPSVLLGDKEKAKGVLIRGADVVELSGSIGLQRLHGGKRER